MINPSDDNATDPVRDGRSAPVTCAMCGCRLEQVGREGAAAYFHFSPLGGRDARGCRVDCAELAHDAEGVTRPISIA